MMWSSAAHCGQRQHCQKHASSCLPVYRCRCHAPQPPCSQTLPSHLTPPHPRMLFGNQQAGSDSSVPSTVEAQQNARNTSDLLRRFRELGERMRQEYQAPPALSEDEAALRVGGYGLVGLLWWSMALLGGKA